MKKSSIKNQDWKIEIKEIEIYSHEYARLVVEGRSTVIEVLVGTTSRYNWICFPEYEKSCELATFDDDFWNKEKLERLINKVDAKTVIGALHILNEKLSDLGRG